MVSGPRMEMKAPEWQKRKSEAEAVEAAKSSPLPDTLDGTGADGDD